MGEKLSHHEDTVRSEIYRTLEKEYAARVDQAGFGQEERYMALWELFEISCDIGELTRARDILAQMDDLEIHWQPSDDPSLYLAEAILHCLGDIDLAEKYLAVSRQRKESRSRSVEDRARLYHLLSVQLEIAARRDPRSLEIPKILRRMQELSRRIGVCNKSFIISMHILAPIRVGGQNACSILNAAWADTAFDCEFRGGDPSLLREIKGLMDYFPDLSE